MTIEESFTDFFLLHVYNLPFRHCFLVDASSPVDLFNESGKEVGHFAVRGEHDDLKVSVGVQEHQQVDKPVLNRDLHPELLHLLGDRPYHVLVFISLLRVSIEGETDLYVVLHKFLAESIYAGRQGS